MNHDACRICLQPLEEGSFYHQRCCRKLFDAPQSPSLPYSWAQINELAEKTVRQHVTVPGVQPKLSVHLERGGTARGGRLTLVGMEGGYILKPPVERYPEMPELEHLTMCMARDFGIRTAECGLIPLEDGRLSFISRRMDRDGALKLHMEDMCQLTDRLTEQKYRASMEQVGRAVLNYCTNTVYDALRLFELTVFCFLTGNADMHLKNFSLLYRPGGEVSLSPAYDLLPTVLLLPEDQEETALTLNGRKRRLTRKDFEQFGHSLKLTERQIENALDRSRRCLPAALDTLGRGLCNSGVKNQFKTLIEQRGARIGFQAE
jgi:serine/threonine-protein kinase HipA